MSWHPSRAVTILAGTAPGGGLDRTARALGRAIEAGRLLDVPVEIVNVPGDGARRVWTEMDRRAGDGHFISISSPNLTTDRLLGLAAFDQLSYTPLATLVTEYIAFVARADGPIASGADLLRRLAQDPGALTVSLATARGNPNHIALALVTRHAGGDIRAPKLRVFDTALDAVADVVAGNSDVGAVTAASALRELSAGRVRALAVSAPERLAGPLAAAPTWTEQGVPCVIGAWRGASGAAGIGAAEVAFWEGVLAAATRSRQWPAELEAHGWAPFHRDGAVLRDHLAREREEMAAALGELGLLKP
jgi:putative tricarboxylic transport membrane protein